jgi:hypothetical protein
MPFTSPASVCCQNVHAHLEDVVQGRTRRVEAELHLPQHELGLALDRGQGGLSGVGSERRKAKNANRVAVAGDGRRRRLPPFKGKRAKVRPE